MTAEFKGGGNPDSFDSLVKNTSSGELNPKRGHSLTLETTHKRDLGVSVFSSIYLSSDRSATRFLNS